MNAKIRALVWEELRVGGSLAGMTTLMGMFLMYAAIVSDSRLHIYSWSVEIVVAFPLISALLLTLNTANSGHLVLGFSRRILRLPVDTHRAVLAILGIRFVEVLVAGGVMTLVCHGFFGRGPGVRTVLLLSEVYLCVQLLDWLWAVAAPLVPMIIALALYTLAVNLGGVSAWGQELAVQESVTPAFLAAWALSFAVAYGLSVLLVGWTRCNKRLAFCHRTQSSVLAAASSGKQKRPFASPLAAQIWLIARRMRLIFPGVILLLWLVFCGAVWLARSSRPHIRHGADDPIMATLAFELFPFLALLLGAFAWGQLTAARNVLKGFALTLPVTRDQTVRARLLVSGISLGIVLAVATLVHLMSFLLTDDGLILRLIRDGLTNRETDFREVVRILFMPSLIAGFLGWFFMGLQGRPHIRPFTFRACAYLGLIILAILLFFVSAISILHGAFFGNSEYLVLGLYALFLFLLLVIVFVVVRLFLGWGRGFIPSRTFGVCLALYCVSILLALLALSPHGVVQTLVAFMVGASAGTMVTAPYVLAVARSRNRDCGETSPCENPNQHLRAEFKSTSGRRVVSYALLAASTVFFVWLLWPAEPAYLSSLRSQGVPTNLAELDAWYPSVPDDRNLANRYLQLGRKLSEGQIRWNTAVTQKWSTSAGSREEADRAIDNLMLFGGAEVGRTEQVPASVWETTRRYWEMAVRDISPDLHATAHSGLTESRYPADLTKGFSTDLSYLAPLRNLARVLQLETWTAIVDRRPDTAREAILDTLPIANSLNAEPILISQLVRFGIYSTALASLETSMNRISFSDEDLKVLQEGLGRALPPLSDGSMLSRALRGEELMVLDWTDQSNLVSSIEQIMMPRGEPENYYVERVAFCLTGTFGRFVVTRLHSILQEYGHELARTNNMSRRSASALFDSILTPHLTSRTFPLSQLLPGFSRAYMSEWRVRVSFDLARTAIAVERFRLAHGQLPQRLDELVPAFLDAIPTDPWNDGKPVSYRVRDNGEFVVYSFNANGEDDQGIELPKEKRSSLDGDITFTVAPPECRNRPQVALPS